MINIVHYELMKHTNDMCFVHVYSTKVKTIEQYVTDLKHKAKTYNYWILEEYLIRDNIVLGTLNLKMNDKLLSNDNLDLEKQYSFA